jgi:hypothetical protein
LRAARITINYLGKIVTRLTATEKMPKKPTRPTGQNRTKSGCSFRYSLPIFSVSKAYQTATMIKNDDSHSTSFVIFETYDFGKMPIIVDYRYRLMKTDDVSFFKWDSYLIA